MRGEGYLEEPDEEDDGAHGAHHAAVVVEERFPAAAAPQVELLGLVVPSITDAEWFSAVLSKSGI